MGFFEDMADMVDPLGITDFDNDGTHDTFEAIATYTLFDEMVNKDDNSEDEDNE